MGNKRTIKSRFNKCFSCGHVFKNYKEKNISKIDVADEYKLSNSVVICPVCQDKVVRGKLILYEILFTFKELSALLGSKELAEKIRNKIYNTRRKYKVDN